MPVPYSQDLRDRVLRAYDRGLRTTQIYVTYPGACCLPDGSCVETGGTCDLPGDLDGDGDVDMNDFVAFEDCLSGADTPPPGGHHHDIPLEEEDALRKPFGVNHFHHCDSLEQPGERRKALIVEVEMPVHVLVDGRQLIRDRFVQPFDTLLRTPARLIPTCRLHPAC